MGSRYCDELVWRAKDQIPMNTVASDAELWKIAKSWLRKFLVAREDDNYAEKFIYLWITVNAWASIAAKDITQNYNDNYLVHCMAAEPKLLKQFEESFKNDKDFQKDVCRISSLAPVFKVLWLRNKGVGRWDPIKETRKEYVNRIMSLNPIEKKGDQIYQMFAPACAMKHMEKNEEIPKDWAHIIHTIYQIRCNLFHGWKDYSNEQDKEFIILAYKILWKVWKCMLPDHLIRWLKELENRESQRCFQINKKRKIIGYYI